MNDRMTLLEVRAVVAIHGGRVEVREATTPGDAATYVLRGCGLVLALLATNGTVDRILVSTWVQQIRLWDARAHASPPEQPDPSP